MKLPKDTIVVIGSLEHVGLTESIEVIILLYDLSICNDNVCEVCI